MPPLSQQRNVSMNEIVRKLADQLREIERQTAEELRSRQTTRTFSGALRVEPDKVYIDAREGRRVIESLSRRLG